MASHHVSACRWVLPSGIVLFLLLPALSACAPAPIATPTPAPTFMPTAEPISTATPLPTDTATPTFTPSPTAEPTVAPTATRVEPSPTATVEPTPLWQSDNIAAKEQWVNGYISRIDYIGFSPDQINSLNRVFSYLKYVKNHHDIPSWAQPQPFDPNNKTPFFDNPLRFLNYANEIIKITGGPRSAGNKIVWLDPAFPNYKPFTSETMWITQAAWLMKESANNAWLGKEPYQTNGPSGADSYQDLVAHYAFVFTLQDMLDAKKTDGSQVINDAKVRGEISIIINDYTSLLNNKAIEKGWKK